MNVVLVHVRVKPERVDDFISAIRINHESSIHEPGNHRFDVLQDPDDPTHFLVYEVYATEANAKAHKDTPHYLAWREAAAEMMAEPRKGETWRGLFIAVDRP